MANEKRLKLCGDCIHADICKEVVGSWFSHKNPAYCKGFKDRANYVEVVHAKWVLVGGGVGCCSNCHRFDGIDELATHCRYCGAKLDGDGNG